MTTELSRVLDEEEKRWMETLHIEEYQITLARTVIQVHTHTHRDRYQELTEVIDFFS